MGKGGKAKGKGGAKGSWVRINTSFAKKPFSKGKGKGKFTVVKGKGKSKGFAPKGFSKGFGKGKGKRAPALNSSFWTSKLEDEARQELGGNKIHNGTIQRYNWKAGWGFIRPDNMNALPNQVRSKIKESEAAAAAEGKELTAKGLLYFRKPDVIHEDGFKVADEVPVKFKVYVDEKGAGAYDVSQRGGATAVQTKGAGKAGKAGKSGKGGVVKTFVKTITPGSGKGKGKAVKGNGKEAKGKGKGKGKEAKGSKGKPAKVDSSLKVWIGNVADGVAVEDIEALFKTAGKVKFAKLGKNNSAMVAFEQSKAVANAISSFNGVDLEGQAIEVDTWSKAE